VTEACFTAIEAPRLRQLPGSARCVQCKHTGCTPDAQASDRCTSSVHPVCFRCTPLVHIVASARGCRAYDNCRANRPARDRAAGPVAGCAQPAIHQQFIEVKEAQSPTRPAKGLRRTRTGSRIVSYWHTSGRDQPVRILKAVEPASHTCAALPQSQGSAGLGTWSSSFSLGFGMKASRLSSHLFACLVAAAPLTCGHDYATKPPVESG
jgi:hypothetical protein